MMEELVVVVNVGRMDVWIGKQLFGREEQIYIQLDDDFNDLLHRECMYFIYAFYLFFEFYLQQIVINVQLEFVIVLGHQILILGLLDGIEAFVL